MVVEHPEGGAQVVGHLLGRPRVGRDRHGGRPPQLPLQRGQQRLPRVDVRQHLAHPVGYRHQPTAELFGQRAQQRRDELLAQPRDGERQRLTGGPGGDPVEHRERHVDGDAVLGRARREGVRQRQGQPLREVHLVRIVLGAHLPGGRRVGEHLRREGEQVRRLLPGGLPPAVEVPGGDDVGRDPGVVELEHGLLVDADVPSAGAFLELGDLLDGALVVGPEPVVRRPLPLDEGVPDEQLPRDDRVDGAVLHPPADDQR
jgi:hypothetical protein